MNCVYDLISRMEVEGRPVGCPDGGFPFDLGNGVNFNLVKEFAFFLDNEVALHVGNGVALHLGNEVGLYLRNCVALRLGDEEKSNICDVPLKLAPLFSTVS